LTYGTAYAYPFVYEEALNDIAMDVPGLIEDTAARVLAAQEGTAFITGNGTARPTGFLNGNAVSPLTIVSTGDEASPQRAFGSVQYFATGAAAAFQDDWAGGTASPVQDPAGVLFDTVYGLKAEYRSNARWMTSKATLAAVRKFRDANGNYLYIPGLVVGQPATLLGYPITEAEAMPAIAANACVMAFADFNAAYQIGDIVGTLRITIDDNITAPGWVKYYIRKRVGGNLANDDAIKVVKCAAS
ncbi:MAG: phage major capsid protein, partial [Gammaproteobacteria bacterium]|nr:phage major capsid protein [Gammaproteobacteria bacterium]